MFSIVEIKLWVFVKRDFTVIRRSHIVGKDITNISWWINSWVSTDMETFASLQSRTKILLFLYFTPQKSNSSTFRKKVTNSFHRQPLNHKSNFLFPSTIHHCHQCNVSKSIPSKHTRAATEPNGRLIFHPGRRSSSLDLRLLALA